MKFSLCVSFTCCLAVSVTGFAQIPAGQRVGLVVYLKAGYQGLKVNLTAAAEKMPEALAGLIAHNSEMYGISTVYLRAKNIVPPSTEQQVLRQGGQKQK